MKETITLKVSGKSNCKAVAGSLSYFLKGDEQNPPKDVVLSAIGAAANNQLIKALAISSGHLAQAGQSLAFRVGFTTVVIGEEERTMMLYYPVLL